MFLDIGIISRLTLAVGCFLVLVSWLYERLVPYRRNVAAPKVRLRDSPALRSFVWVFLGLTAVCYTSIWYWRRVLVARNTPYFSLFPYVTPFLFFQNYYDLLVYLARVTAIHSPRFFSPALGVAWQYPPAMGLVYGGLFFRGAMPGIVVFFSTATCALTLGCCALARRLTEEGLSCVVAYAVCIGSLVLSYPFWTELALGNTELAGFLLVAAGLLCFFRRHPTWAGIFFGLAAAIKLFPFVYFGLLLAHRQFRAILAGVAAGAAATLAGLWLLCPDLRYSWHQVQAGLAKNREHYMLTWLQQETGIDHSGFGLIKRIAVHHFGVHMPPVLLTGYMAIVATVGLLAYFLRIQRLPVLNQVAALCVASILLPPTSHDYTLIHLYLPWAPLMVLAVQSARQRKPVPGLTAALVCFALLFASESELIHHANDFSGQFKCLVLIVLFALTLRFPWRLETRDDAKAAIPGSDTPPSRVALSGRSGETGIPIRP